MSAQPRAEGAPTLLEAGVVCPHCDAYNNLTETVCHNCQEFMGEAIEPTDPETVIPEAPVDQAPDQYPTQATTAPVPGLRLLRGYGTKNNFFPLGNTPLTIGRSPQASLPIRDDPFLSPMHASLHAQPSGLVVQDLGSRNGTFVRLLDGSQIQAGDELVLGSQRLILIGIGGPTKDVRIPPSSDTRSYGGPAPKDLFLALRIIHQGPEATAIAGAVLLRAGPTVTIGQRGCDVNFPEDPRLAPHHIDLFLQPTGTLIRLPPDSTGVFLRLRDPFPLEPGDELLVGEEVFRFEA